MASYISRQCMYPSLCVCACIMLGLSHSLTHTLLGGGGTWVRLRSRRGRHGESRAGQVHSDTNCSPYREETRRQTDRSSTAAVAPAAVLPLALSARTPYAYTTVCFSLSLPKTVCVRVRVFRPHLRVQGRRSVPLALPQGCVCLYVCVGVYVCVYVRVRHWRAWARGERLGTRLLGEESPTPPAAEAQGPPHPPLPPSPPPSYSLSLSRARTASTEYERAP
jgi:hypothetical protein